MPGKVKCIQSDGDDGFTIGKVYDVLEKGLGDVSVIDDEGNQSYLLDDEYEIMDT